MLLEQIIDISWQTNSFTLLKHIIYQKSYISAKRVGIVNIPTYKQYIFCNYYFSIIQLEILK